MPTLRGYSRSEAAYTLARRKDGSILPRLLHWVHRGDRPRFNVALTSLRFLMDPDEHRDLLERAWERNDRQGEGRAVLAASLLGLGDGRGLTFLEAVTRLDERLEAIHAVRTIHDHDRAQGLELMAWVLDHAEPEKSWSLAERIARLANLPHVWTVDGLAESRNWVAQRLEEMGQGRPPIGPRAREDRR